MSLPKLSHWKLKRLEKLDCMCRRHGLPEILACEECMDKLKRFINAENERTAKIFARKWNLTCPYGKPVVSEEVKT